MMVLQQAARRMADALGQESAIVRTARPMYQRALAWLSAGRGIPWTINGAPFRIDPFQRHRMGAVYDPEVAAFIGRHLRPGAVCLDVGANVGVYALQFARWTGPEGHVVAFEPNPVSAAILAEHVRLNDLDDLVTIVQSAIADRSGIGTLHMSDADGMSRLGVPNPEIASRTQSTRVEIMTLDGYCAQHDVIPDWLMIDVEGFEFAVLGGARQLIQDRGPAMQIVVEMHPNAWEVAGWSRSTAEALLRELQLTAISLTGVADPFADYGHALLRPRSAGTLS